MAVAMDETEGLLKLVATADGRIVGCHVCGADAAFLVQEVAALMQMKATVADLADTIHIHPTLSEVLHAAALEF